MYIEHTSQKAEINCQGLIRVQGWGKLMNGESAYGGMLQNIRGFAQFISVERGLMLFMISIGATFLAGEAFALPAALFLGAIVFCVWSAVDAMNNLCDVDLDVLSDPLRAKFTKRLGKAGLFIAVGFTVLSLALGALTLMPYVVLFVGLGLFFGVVYSVPPFRLRKTPYKPTCKLYRRRRTCHYYRSFLQRILN